MGMRGVYQEIVPPERLVSTESFDDYPGESQNTLVLVEDRGRTTLTITVLYQSREIRDAVIKSGMEHGAAECYDKLAELLASADARWKERGASGSCAKRTVSVALFDASAPCLPACSRSSLFFISVSISSPTGR